MTQQNAEKRRARALQETTGRKYNWCVNMIRLGLSDDAIVARAERERRGVKPEPGT